MAEAANTLEGGNSTPDAGAGAEAGRFDGVAYNTCFSGVITGDSFGYADEMPHYRRHVLPIRTYFVQNSFFGVINASKKAS